jgi:hypothetical protein
MWSNFLFLVVPQSVLRNLQKTDLPRILRLLSTFWVKLVPFVLGDAGLFDREVNIRNGGCRAISIHLAIYLYLYLYLFASILSHLVTMDLSRLIQV